MRKQLGLLFLVLSVKLVFGQKDTCMFDDEGLKQGFWQLTAGISFLKFEEKVNGVEAVMYGFFVDDLKQGIWEVKNSKSKLIAHLVYKDDILVLEIQYWKNRPSSIIHYTREEHYTENPNLADYIYRYQQIISLNKRGQIKRRSFIRPDGQVEIKSYK